jgi:hypothetical protein
MPKRRREDDENERKRLADENAELRASRNSLLAVHRDLIAALMNMSLFIAGLQIIHAGPVLQSRPRGPPLVFHAQPRGPHPVTPAPPLPRTHGPTAPVLPAPPWLPAVASSPANGGAASGSGGSGSTPARGSTPASRSSSAPALRPGAP